MTNTWFHTAEEATLVTEPPPLKTNIEAIDPLLLDLNRADWEPLTMADNEQIHEVEKQVELRKVIPLNPDQHHNFMRERFEEIRQTLGDAWRAMEHSVDEAVSSLSSGRDL